MPGSQRAEESTDYLRIARSAGTAWPTSGSTRRACVVLPEFEGTDDASCQPAPRALPAHPCSDG